MTFGALNAAVTDLRNVLRAFVGGEALREINVRPPAGGADEASFFRLVAWSYALNFEAGRIAIPYLAKLPSKGEREVAALDATRTLVHALRTWSFHNLGYSTDRDIALSRRVHLWFQEICGASAPVAGSEWEACCGALCDEMVTLVIHCSSAMDVVLASDDSGESTIADLRRRVHRAWPAHRFDEVVDDAATRLGISVDSKGFREPRLSKWREYLAVIPEGDDVEGHIIRLIERELLEHSASVLPIDGRDVMAALGIGPGPEVADELRRARDLYRAGVREPLELLTQLCGDSAGSVEGVEGSIDFGAKPSSGKAGT